MVDVLNNKEAFLRKEPKKLFLIVILLVIFILLLILITKIEIYDNYQTKGYGTCSDECSLAVVIPSNLTYDKIYINNKLVDYTVLSEELEVDEDNMVSYIKLFLKTDNKYRDKEIVNINFYYNKQRIITKIKEKMF